MVDMYDHNVTYNITPISLDSPESSTIDLLSLGYKSHRNRANDKQNIIENGIYTPESTSDSSEIKLEVDYKTKSKSNVLSHPNTFCNWTEDEIAILKRQIEIDLTLDALISVIPNKPLAFITKKIRHLQPLPVWTRGETYSLIETILNDPKFSVKEHKHKFPCRSAVNLDKKCQHYKKLIRRLNVMNYRGRWTNPELTTLINLIDYDLTKATLENELPEKGIDEIRSATERMKISSSFSCIESILFERSIARDCRIESILDQFPLKGKEASRKKLLKLTELPQYSHIAAKRLAELDVIIQKEFKSIRDSIDFTRLSYLISNDLTGEQLRLLFPGISMKSLKSVADELGFNENVYTLAEVESLKQALQENVKLTLIFDELPFRSQLSIERKINEIEPNRRRSVFSNKVDELVYMAQWYSSDNFGNMNSKRKSRDGEKLDQVKDVAKKTSKPMKKELKDTDIAIHCERLMNEKTNIFENENKILQVKSANISKRPASMVDILREESTYFQTVTGDGHLIKEGEKRKRERPVLIKREMNAKKPKNQKPCETNKNRKIKGLIKNNVKPEKTKGETVYCDVGKVKEKNVNVSDIHFDFDTIVSVISETIKKEKEDKRSPYDPEDIITDTSIPLYGRHLYVNEIYDHLPSIRELSFIDDSDIMVQGCDDIALSDSIAADIISEHRKNYRDMPISFPPLTIMDKNTNKMIINPMNKIRVRFLLYPQHSELFVLAEPKSNELDPINEIKKLFQLHYGLFFSHSSKLKRIIVDEYNKELDNSIDENDFNRFMFVIDKWNRLMIELCPNEVNVGLQDMNEEIRTYFLPSEIKLPTDEDIRLDLFFSEILRSEEESPLSDNDPIEPPSPSFDLIETIRSNFGSGQSDHLTPPISSEEDNKENEPPIEKYHRNNINQEPIRSTPMKINMRNKQFVNALKPANYRLSFFRHLNEKTTVSRFCLQQILLRIYSRIVSTQSKKLRSYKAFTAEVYGELLPSFTSEVLSKVNLQPHQKFYDLGSGVGNTTFQAALEFGAFLSGGCEIMEHASKLTELQTILLNKHLSLFGLNELPLNFALLQSFVGNDMVREAVIECDVLLINNYLFDVNLNTAVGKMLYGLKPGTKIISLRNFIRPRYKASSDETVFDYLKVEMHEMSNYLSVSWTANKVPYYISTVQKSICQEYLS